MNVTSALRSPEMLDFFLEQYTDEHSNSAALAQQLLERFPADEIPYILPNEQELFFYSKYSPTFPRQKPDRAFFWELVNKPADSIPIKRIPGTDKAASEQNSTNTTRLARWFLHPIYYKAYMRNEEGTVIPIEDPETLSLIEEQMRQWIEFHIDFTNELFEKLQREQAVGLAMPGDEFDLVFEGNEWVHRPHHPSSDDGNSDSRPSLDDSPDDKPPCKPGSVDCEDDYFEPLNAVPPGTYTEPLIVQTDETATRTVKETTGLIVLCSTIGCTLLWSLVAMVYRRRRFEQENWGANVGTEHALQELLSVGWKLQDQHETGQEPRQVLVIYDKTEHAMGYRDEDSLLMGGMAPPLFPGITD
ncbi:expressed unknown protein [Seminavis robusta]|uniref:Uncharacterized protein n=1 Tax=Seminavis robusta TaxID=568900 RepID=A0A9N8DSP2_9STRA|nr:expressed unknown protein [Seminavis robusta]|eukprot:Sro325_g117700.1 n/a (359) ;mRNA; f:9365-10441